MPVPPASFWGQQPGRSFVSASTHYAQIDIAAVSDVPITMAAWVFPVSFANDNTIMCVCNSSAADNSLLLALQSNGTAKTVTYGAYYRSAASTGALPSGKWTHVAGVIAGTADRKTFIRGVQDGSSTDATTVSGLNRTALGRLARSSPVDYFNGKIFWPCIWSAALSASEIRSLASGVPPWLIRPRSIASCPDLTSLYDPFLRASWTNSGTTLATPRMWLPSRKLTIGKVPSGAPATTIFSRRSPRNARAGSRSVA